MAPPPMRAARLPPVKAAVVAPSARRRSVVPIVLGSITAALVVTVVVLVALIPGIVRDRCIAAAAARGVTLTVDHVSIGFGDVRLVQVGFKLVGVPQIAGNAGEIDVSLSGLTPTDASVAALGLSIDGAAEDVQTALEGWSAAQAKASAPLAPSAGNKVSFAGAHIVWTRAFGQTAKIDATDAQGTLDGAKSTLSFTSDKVAVTAGRASFGPWRVGIDRDAQGTRTHVELDPVVHGGPQATYVRNTSGAVSLTANIPSSPLSRLGIPPASVGLTTDANVEGTFDLELALTRAATLKSTVSLSNVVFSGVPVDAKLDLTAAGDMTKGLDVKQGSLTVGPLRATLSGTVKIFGDGARLALAWKSQPIACTQLVKDYATSALGGMGTALNALAGAVGGSLGVKVSGEASASGLVTLDSRDLGAASVTMTSNDTCGVALF